MDKSEKKTTGRARVGRRAPLDTPEQKVDALAAELKSMLHIFDRGLEPGTIGRMVCDEARATLKAIGKE